MNWWTILKQITFPRGNEWQDIIEDNELDKYNIQIDNFTNVLEEGQLTNQTRKSLESLDTMLSGMETEIEKYEETNTTQHGFLRSMLSRIRDIDEIKSRIVIARQIYKRFDQYTTSLKLVKFMNDINPPKEDQSEKEYVLETLNIAYQNFLTDPKEETAEDFVYIGDFGRQSDQKLFKQKHEQDNTLRIFKKYLRSRSLREVLENRDIDNEHEAFRKIWTTVKQPIVDKIANLLEIKASTLRIGRDVAPKSVAEAIERSKGLGRVEEEEVQKLKLGEKSEEALESHIEWQKLERIIKYLLQDNDLMQTNNPLYLWKDKPRALAFLMHLYRNPRYASTSVRPITMAYRGTGRIRGQVSGRAWAQNKIIQLTKTRRSPSIWGIDLMADSTWTKLQQDGQALKTKNSELSNYRNLLEVTDLNENDSNTLNEYKEKYGDTTELSNKEAIDLDRLENKLIEERRNRARAISAGSRQTTSEEHTAEYREFIDTYKQLFERFKDQKPEPGEFAQAMKDAGQPMDESILESLTQEEVEDFDMDSFTSDIENNLVLNLVREMISAFVSTTSNDEYINKMSTFFEPEGEEEYIGDIVEFTSTDPEAFPKAFATLLTIYEQVLNEGKQVRNQLSKAIIEDFPRNVSKGITGRKLKRRKAILSNLDLEAKKNLGGALDDIENAIQTLEQGFEDGTDGIRSKLQEIVREMLNSIADNVTNVGPGTTRGVRIRSGTTKRGKTKAVRRTVRDALLEFDYLTPEDE